MKFIIEALGEDRLQIVLPNGSVIICEGDYQKGVEVFIGDIKEIKIFINSEEKKAE